MVLLAYNKNYLLYPVQTRENINDTLPMCDHVIPNIKIVIQETTSLDLYTKTQLSVTMLW